jgi:hypothetical protein
MTLTYGTAHWEVQLIPDKLLFCLNLVGIIHFVLFLSLFEDVLSTANVIQQRITKDKMHCNYLGS